MNIAVFGWYHHRNAGDDRLQYCLTRWLDGHTLAFLPAGRRLPPLSFLRSYDAVLIGGGGLLQRRGGMFRDMGRWVRRVGIPVALVGVSIERLPDDLRRELLDLLDACCFAWFRDAGSLEALGGHGSAFVAPDLTWRYPFAMSPPGSGTSVCLRYGANVPQESWRQVLAGCPGPVRPWPLYFESGNEGRLLEAVVPNASAPDEFSLDPARQSAAVVSTRYHGLVFGAQLGRPVVGVGGEPKVRRFLTESGLGDWWLPDDDLSALPGRLEALLSAEAGPQDTVGLRSRLHREAIEAGDRALTQLVAAADARPRRLVDRWRARS